MYILDSLLCVIIKQEGRGQFGHKPQGPVVMGKIGVR